VHTATAPGDPLASSFACEHAHQFRGEFGHTPLSAKEEIPWTCRRLVIGTGTGALPVMNEVKREAARRKIKLLILPTAEAIEELNKHPPARPTPSST
jgi:hypothetical protein